VIRVGLVGGDFRTHSCAFFLLQLLKNLDRSRVHVTCIYTVPLQDAITEKFRTLADDFVALSEPPQTVLVAAVRNARIDVLIDLCGHTSGSQLAAMHMRPAPVQGTYLGYANTTGLDAIQFRIVDSLTDPFGADAHATERLVRLDPCFLCFEPPADASAVAPCPSNVRGHVTFGSFNSPIKLNDPLVGLWARVLHAVPGSRLILKGEALGDSEFAGIVRDKFVKAGVDAARLDLLGKIATINSHLDAYAQVDIALDSFPYHGTTTTCEAMWMGVPVVSRLGDVHASRVGLSLLSAVGLADLASESDDGFVAAAVALADNAERRSELRASLRERMRSSPLCDGEGFAQRFEAAIREQWRDWCERQSPSKTK
jgi:predicted O-linked N-acetylglucosamine transferase (SPINDLY family)